MAILKDIRKRITSVRNTQQITKAMKIVSASKLRRAQLEIESSHAYTKKIRELILRLMCGGIFSENRFSRPSSGKKAVILIINSDKGLCAGLNNNLNKFIAKNLLEIKKQYEEVQLGFFGRKGKEFFARSNYSDYCTHTDLSDVEYKQYIRTEIQKLIEAYTAEKISSVYLAFNRFKSVIKYEPTFLKLFPPDLKEPEQDEQESEIVEYVFEPSQEEVLEQLLEKSIMNQAYTALLDNLASEQAARMMAMDAATNNAKDVISKLQLQYNRARQASITKELIEIISGADAIH